MTIETDPCRALMLTDDIGHLDRRVAQEAGSLLAAGTIDECVVFSPSPLAEPRTQPRGMAILGAAASDSNSIQRIGLRRSILRIASAIGLTGPMQTWICRLRDPARRCVREHVDRPELQGFDAIIVHSLTLLPLGLELAARAGCGPRPVVFDAHELFDEQHDSIRSASARAYWRRVGDEFIPRATSIMTVTPRIAAAMAERHSLASTPTVVLNACPYVDQVRGDGRLRALYRIAPSTRIVLCQGALLPGRGLEELARAARSFDRERIAVVFLGPGDPAYAAQLDRIAGGRAFIGKSVHQDELLQHTAEASLGVITNRGSGLNNTDGGPNRLFEYIQARVPVLAYSHRGVADVLTATGTGWTVGWGDSNECARAIEDALEKADRVPSTALDRAARQFSWEAQEPALLAAVGRVLGR